MPGSTSRRTRGEGSLYRVADGAWRGAVLVNGKRRYVSGRTKTETAARVAKLRSEADRGIAAGPRLTVNDQLTAWMGAVRQRVRPSTLRGYEQHVRTNIRPALGKVSLARLTPTDVERIPESMMISGRAPRTANATRTVLALALGDASSLPNRVRFHETSPSLRRGHG